MDIKKKYFVLIGMFLLSLFLPLSFILVKDRQNGQVLADQSNISRISFKVAFEGVKSSSTCLTSLNKIKTEVVNKSTNTIQSDIDASLTLITNETNNNGDQIYLVSNIVLDSKFNNVNNSNYIRVKGLFHLTSRMCLNNQSEKLDENVVCDINLTNTATYDFSNYALMSGDINQDGIVNSLDFSIIKNNLNASADISCGLTGDLNLDGIVNSLDASLLKINLLQKEESGIINPSPTDSDTPTIKPTNTPIPTLTPTTKPGTTTTPTNIPTINPPKINPINSIQIRPSPLILEKNKSWKAQITTDPEGLTASYVWKSSNGNVATVDMNGLVKGKSVGEANLTANVKNTLVSNTVKITVKLPETPTVGPTARPTTKPTSRPTTRPTSRPTTRPTSRPTLTPTTIRPNPTPTIINPADVNTTIIISNDKSYRVPEDFLGFSTESTSLCKYMDKLKDNSVLQNLYKNLAPGVWRIGGNSVEDVEWDEKAGSCDNKTINSKLVDDVFSFAKKINWKIIYDISLKNNTSGKVKKEAQYVFSKYSNSLHSFEIGNEPDLYSGEGKSMSFEQYINKWKNFAHEIKSISSGANIIGPSCLGQMNKYINPYRLEFFNNFIQMSKGLVTSTSFHLYPVNSYYTNTNFLHNEQLYTDTKEVIKNFSNISKNNSLPLRLAETNTGGEFGVSDTYATTLWTIDYLFTALESGIKGVNFHGYHLSTRNHYSPIWTTDNVPFATPEYYGLLFFKQAASNGRLVNLRNNTYVEWLSSYAVENDNKNLQLAIINKSTSKKAYVKIPISSTYKKAYAIRLTAPSLSTTITSANSSSITLGGSSVRPDGSWSAISKETVRISGGNAMVAVPKTSAILITFEP